MIMVYDFERTTNAFNYIFYKEIPAHSTIFLKIPVVSANKRGVNDIGWQCDGNDVELYATIAPNPSQTTLWSVVKENYVVNKTISALKFENNDNNPCTLCVRVIMN